MKNKEEAPNNHGQALWEISVHAKLEKACQEQKPAGSWSSEGISGAGWRRHDEVSFRRRAQADSAGEAEALGPQGLWEDHDLAASVTSLEWVHPCSPCFAVFTTPSLCFFYR